MRLAGVLLARPCPAPAPRPPATVGSALMSGLARATWVSLCWGEGEGQAN